MGAALWLQLQLAFNVVSDSPDYTKPYFYWPTLTQFRADLHEREMVAWRMENSVAAVLRPFPEPRLPLQLAWEAKLRQWKRT
jgi:hypothetical protein